MPQPTVLQASVAETPRLVHLKVFLPKGDLHAVHRTPRVGQGAHLPAIWVGISNGEIRRSQFLVPVPSSRVACRKASAKPIRKWPRKPWLPTSALSHSDLALRGWAARKQTTAPGLSRLGLVTGTLPYTCANTPEMSFLAWVWSK